jgi:hypothetical protein
MRVFLCAFGDFTLAVPVYAVSSLLLYGENNDNNNIAVSLPDLFKHQDVNIKHGLILNGEAGDKRVVLLTTEVECETDIPTDKIIALPKTFNRFNFSTFFSGFLFDSRQDQKEIPILVLNAGYFARNIYKEKTV